eukprot:10773738-Lingulodinium_polyedra.AAC.1
MPASAGAGLLRAWPAGAAVPAAAELAPGPAGLDAPHLRHADLEAQLPGQAHPVHVQSRPLPAPVPMTCSTRLEMASN